MLVEIAEAVAPQRVAPRSRTNISPSRLRTPPAALIGPEHCSAHEQILSVAPRSQLPSGCLTKPAGEVFTQSARPLAEVAQLALEIVAAGPALLGGSRSRR
jgi:hypothetical protein